MKYIKDDCILLGVDPALTNLGAAVRLCDGSWHTRWIKTAPLRGSERLGFIYTALTEFIREHVPPDVDILCAIEGHAYGKRTGKELAEAVGVCRLAMFDQGLPEPLIVPPSSAKAFLAGKGNADKEAMIKAAMIAIGDMDVTISDHEADSVAVASVVACAGKVAATTENWEVAVIQNMGKQLAGWVKNA